MEYKRYGDAYAVRFDRGEEVLSSLLALCETERISLASVSALGAVDQAVLGVYDLVSGVYEKRSIDAFCEIGSLVGSVTQMDGKPYLHLHAVLCGQNGLVAGGHAIELRVGATCELFLHLLSGTLERKKDAETGLNLFAF